MSCWEPALVNYMYGHKTMCLRTSVVVGVLTGVGSASVAMVASRYIEYGTWSAMVNSYLNIAIQCLATRAGK